MIIYLLCDSFACLVIVYKILLFAGSALPDFLVLFFLVSIICKFKTMCFFMFQNVTCGSVDGGYVFTSVCLSVYEQDISKSCGRIWQVGEQVGCVMRTN